MVIYIYFVFASPKNLSVSPPVEKNDKFTGFHHLLLDMAQNSFLMLSFEPNLLFRLPIFDKA